MSSAAACVAETVTYPLDLTKTRLQLQGEGGSGAHYRGMFGTAAGIVKEEGALMLWRGLLPALIRHVVYTGMRMSAYEEIRYSGLGLIQRFSEVPDSCLLFSKIRHFRIWYFLKPL